MDGAYGLMVFIVEQDGDAVGRRHTDAQLPYIGHHGIYTFQQLRFLFVAESQKVLADAPYLSAMHLMRIYQPVVTDLQQAAQRQSIGSDMTRLVAAIVVHVKLAVVAHAASASTGGAESNYLR